MVGARRTLNTQSCSREVASPKADASEKLAGTAQTQTWRSMGLTPFMVTSTRCFAEAPLRSRTNPFFGLHEHVDNDPRCTFTL